MKNKVLSVSMLCGLVAAVPTHAETETWNCSYDGTWDTFNSSNEGVFNWQVTWQLNDEGQWDITGSYSDRYGDSILDGACNDDSCLLSQVYSSGDLQGKRYYWRGDYQDEQTNNTTTTNSFTGTWGTNKKATDGGNWKAIATCIRS